MDIEAPRHAIGKGTAEAIQSGVVYGYAGQVDAILGRLREELGEEATAIATGGFAKSIVPFCEQVDEVDDLLTLTGLKLVFERNRRLTRNTRAPTRNARPRMLGLVAGSELH